MNNTTENDFGTPFERIFVTFISIATGITLIYLAIEGPLFYTILGIRQQKS
jgi:hypothetical protein